MAALSGIVILDLTQMFPGPYCTALLRSLGAQVCKIERPGDGDRSRLMPDLFANLNSGKRSATVDLRHKEGQAIFLAMAKKADVIVEGFRPGVAARLGVDYAAVKPVAPNIVYCSISGFGQGGPYRNRPGHDINYQALCGALGFRRTNSLIGDYPPFPIADLSSGLFAAFGILSALMERERTGLGMYLDISMTDGLFTWARMFDSMRFPGEQEHISTALPHYGIFETRDGNLIAIGIIAEDDFWDNLCAATGLRQFHGLGLASRITMRAEIETELRRVLRQRDRAEWLQLLEADGIPVTSVNTVEEATQDPQLIHRRCSPVLIGVGRSPIPVVRNTSISEAADIASQHPPEVGQHTEEILAGLGYGDNEIKRLKSVGII